MNDRLRDRYAPGNMRVADGLGGFQEIEAPLFELGTLSAGNLYTTAEDLARFLKCLFAGGRTSDEQVIKSETLKEMFSTQLIDGDEGYGLGFYVGEFSGHKTIGHSGAVYGHSALLRAIPEHKIGVVVLINEDLAGGVARKLGQVGIERMLEAKLGQTPKKREQPIDMEPDELAKFAGDYESESYWAQLEVDAGTLKVNMSGQRLTLTPIGDDKFVADGRFCHRESGEFRRDDSSQVTGFSLLKQTFDRVDTENLSRNLTEPLSRPSGNEAPNSLGIGCKNLSRNQAEPLSRPSGIEAPNGLEIGCKRVGEVPKAWTRFLGSYGPEFIPLIVSVKHGHLYAMTENMVDYRLTPLNRTVFKMPPGMYVDEQLVFQVGPDGEVHSVILANMTLPRRRE